MSSDHVSAAELAQTCATAGFEFEELYTVRHGVYRGTLSEPKLGSAPDVFIKLYRPEKRQAIREFSALRTDVGHPECYLVDGNHLCLVMAKAKGRPLSHLLPIAFLPGMWRSRRNRYEQVYYQLGTQLGRLHSATQRKWGPVLDEDGRKKALRRTRLLDGKLSDSSITKTQELLERTEDCQTPYALTYGDRSPHNIYFDGSSVTQIDFSGLQRSTVYDHASVLVGLRMMHRRLLYPHSGIRTTLEMTYWNGYEQTWNQSLPEEKSITIRCVALYLSLLDFYHSDVNSLNARLTKWIDPPILYDEIRQLVDDTPV